MAQPRIKFTVNDYMTAPPDKRYQLLDGELIVAPSPTDPHQKISLLLTVELHQFVTSQRLGQVRYAPLDVVLSNYDVAQPDILFVSNERSSIITPANIQGAPDLVVEILSPSTAQYDQGYKRTLYSRSGVREYWLVDPSKETVETLVTSEQGLTHQATYQKSDTLVSLLLPGFSVSLEHIFS